MIQMIEERKEVGLEHLEVLGWQVTFSKKVWDRCVAVPKGVEGQTEEGRLHDLLTQIRFNLRRVVVPHQWQLSVAFSFAVNVVNDNRGDSKLLDGIECPGEEHLIAVFASFDGDGSPRLVVFAEPEAASLTPQMATETMPLKL